MSETIYSWVFGLAIALIFLIPYLIKLKHQEKRTLTRLVESKSKGQDKALMQHPIINQSLCIGCGICVSSCPEGDVLGLINGKATIIHGSHCVGHAQCADNCPVGGIEVSLGDISQREDIPRLTKDFETNLSGIYIIGELSGMALIRNAINHGITAVNHIAGALSTSRSDQDYDLIIFGVGPAGLSAALRAQELGLSYLVLDQYKPGGTILNYPRKKITLVQKVSLPLFGELNKLEYSKEKLLEIWETVIRKNQINLQTDVRLSGVERDGQIFSVQTNKGDFHGKKIILALGRRGTPRKLGVAGEELGKTMYKLIDAETYQDNSILVVGGGDSAIEAAVGLAHQKGNRVSLSYRKENFFRLKSRNESNIQRMIDDNIIDVYFESQLTNITPDTVRMDYKDKITSIENDYVFIFAGGELPLTLLNSIGIEFGVKIKAA